MKEVGRPAFFALLIMAIAFLPVLALEGQEGRLFHPLAYAKSLTMLIAAVLAITLDPALRLTFAKLGRRRLGRGLVGPSDAVSMFGRDIRPEERHPLSRLLIRIYSPALLDALRKKGSCAAVALTAAALTVPLYWRLGTEFMPPLDEGVLLYMPSTVASISITEAKRLVQLTDARLRSLPEVAQVLGKAGRADTSTDVAATFDARDHRRAEAARAMAGAPHVVFHLGARVAQADAASLDLRPDLAAGAGRPARHRDAVSGRRNFWTMPIRGRIDMLATGMRTPLGLKSPDPT